VRARGVVLALVCVVSARPLAAQVRRYVDGEAEVSRARFRSAVPGRSENLSGIALGLRLFTTGSMVSVEASYAQGRLTAQVGSGPSRSLVDGSVRAVVHPVPWLALMVGPHLRAYSAPGGTERWVLWEYRARAETPIISPTLPLRLHAGLWTAIRSSVNADPGASGARGGEVGMVWRVPRSPVWLHLSYSVDQAKMRNGARTEALEAVAVTVSLRER
jgi:hypothetical protein